LIREIIHNSLIIILPIVATISIELLYCIIVLRVTGLITVDSDLTCGLKTIKLNN